MKRIFVLSQQSLFGQGIETLLSRESEIDLVRWDADITSANECIQVSNPDFVVLDCDDAELDLSSAIRYIFRERPGTSIIGVSLAHNEASVYRGEQKIILQVADLLDVIMG
jgi:chemotaxis response regulator CheB